MERWRELMMAKLYDESTPEESAELERAFDERPELREEWEALVATRGFIRRSSIETPGPRAPRVLVLPERRRRVTGWGFASGVAASVLLFAIGWLAAPGPVTPATVEQADAGVTLDTAGAVLEALDRIEQLEQQNARLEQRLTAVDPGLVQADNRGAGASGDGPTHALLTRNEFEEGLARVLTRFDYQIQQESQYLLSEMAQRDRRYMQAWRAVARDVPTLSEQ